jgi:DNA-binding XRE family transcriptional regulator
MRIDTPFRQFLAGKQDEVIAERIGVTVRAVQSWRLGERFPRPEQARQIIALLPVTMSDIYSPAGSDAKKKRAPAKATA